MRSMYSPTTRRLSSPRPSIHLAAISRTLAAIRTALASLLAHKAAAQHRQARSQAAPVLLLLWRRALLILHLLALRRVVHLRLLLLLGVLHAALGSAVTVRYIR
jgi:hypothetical protein